MLTRTGEDYHGEEVVKILTGREGCWEAFISTLGWVAVGMEIAGPVLYFLVLKIKSRKYNSIRLSLSNMLLSMCREHQKNQRQWSSSLQIFDKIIYG